MVLVHDVVAHREVGAGFDLLPPRRELLLGLFSALIAYQLRVGQHREPYSGVLHARGNGTDAYRTAPRLRQLFKLLIYQRPDVLAAEEFLQDLGAPLVRREDYYAVVLLEIQRHVVRRRLRAARVGRQLLCRYAGYRPRRQGTPTHGEGLGHIHREVLQPLYQRLPAQIECVRRHGEHAAPRQFADILGELLCIVPRPLAAAAGLVEDNHRILRDVIHGARHRVNHGQVSVRVRYQRRAAEPVGVGAQCRAESSRVLARAATAVFLCKALYLATERIAPSDGHLRQSLRRREYHAFFKRLRAALARHVEMTHGVHVVAPELYTHRLMLRRGEKVQYSPAPRELAGAFDLLRARIAASQQRRLHVLYRVGAAGIQPEGRAAQSFGRQRPLYKSRYRRDGDGAPPLGEREQRGKPLLLRLTRGGLGRIKSEIAHTEASDLLAKHGAQVVCKILRRRIVRAEHEQRRAGFKAQSGGEVCPMHRRKPGNERRKPSALQQTGEGGGFLVFKNLIYKKFHI